MLQPMLIVAVITFSLMFCTEASTLVINASTAPEDSLEHHLCTPGQLEHDTILSLGPGRHEINEGPSCVVENVNNLVITASEAVHVVCINNTLGRNFIFLSIINLTIQNVVIENCGRVISSNLPSFINNTFAYIGTKQKAVFVFGNVTNLRLLNFMVVRSFGFSIIGINLRGNTDLSNMIVADTDNYQHPLCFRTELDVSCSGSGTMFIYSDDEDIVSENTSITVTNGSFTNNENNVPLNLFAPIFVNIRSNFESERLLLIGSTALGFYLGQNSYNVNIRIVSTVLSGNYGYASALVFLFFNTIRETNIEMEGCLVENNEATGVGRGGGMIMLVISYISDLSGFPKYPIDDIHQLFTAHNTSFNNNSASIGGAAYFYLTPQNISDYQITFDNMTFYGNRGGTGSVMEAGSRQATFIQNNVHFLMQDVIASNNTFPNTLLTSSFAENRENSAAFIFIRVFNITVSGRKNTTGSLFSNNSPGAFLTIGGYLFLQGKVEFSRNTALRGAALSFYDYSLLFISEGSRITFAHNSASDVGGAIYANSLGTGSASTCVFQVVGPNRIFGIDQVSLLDLSLRFINNTANDGGNSIYVNPLYGCAYLPESSIVDVSLFYDSSILYQSIFYFESSIDNGLSEIASIPYQLCFCTEEDVFDPNTLCQTSNINVSVIPGQKFYIYAFPVDANLNQVSSIAFVDVKSTTHRLETAQTTRQLDGATCMPIDLNIYGQEFTYVLLTLRTELGVTRLSVNAWLEGCPPGFVINSINNFTACICDPYITSTIQSVCNFTTYTISKPQNLWLGVIKNSEFSDVVFIQTCPIGFCKLTADMTFVDLTQKDPLCQEGRTGILCGACKDNLSVVFGSPECMKCTHYWLFTIPLYAVAGILLVIFLFLLNLSVHHGTMNGTVVIFYVNIISVNSNILFPSSNRGFLFIWISLLNLELGFPLCFYDGMNEAFKAGLQAIFPVYLLFICLGIIFISRWSISISKLTSSHGIHVLATLIYLSFSKMLKYVIDILSFATLNSEGKSQIVWLFDGNLEYFTGEHAFIVIVPSLITLFFIVSYGTALVFIKQIEQRSSKLKPLLDAYAGLFKDKFRFWFGFRLFVLTVMCIMYATFGTDDPILAVSLQLVILILFMIVEAYLQPFRSKVVLVVDLIYLFDLSLLLLYTMRVFSSASFENFALEQRTFIINTLVSIAFILFMLLLLYHVYKIPKLEAVLKPLVSKRKEVSVSDITSLIPCQRCRRSPSEVVNSDENGVKLSAVKVETTSTTVVSLANSIDADNLIQDSFSRLRESTIDN